MIKVLIQRKIKEGKWPAYQDVVNRIRNQAENFKGYVSGEVLTSQEDESKILVISTWKDLDSWNTWVKSKERDSLLEGLKGILEGEEEVSCFTLQS